MKQMKDSGIEWIGECPEHWGFVRGRYLFKQRNTKGNLKNLELLSPSQKFGVVPQTLLEELTTQTVVKVKEDTNLETFKTIHVGDFCISLRSFQGGFEYSKYEGVVSSAYQVFYPIVPIYDGYYKFLFKDKSFIEKMNSYTISFRDGKNIAFEDFGNTYIPYLPIDEQRKIAEFLDKKCEEVDGLIADIQTQIDTLEQYKRSTITEAVAKGLNPTVEMKDSGYEWIGESPKSWKFIRGRYLFKQRSTKGNLKNLELLSPSQKFGVVPQTFLEEMTTQNVVKVREDTNLETFKTIHVGDFCISLRSFQGGFEYSKYEGVVSSAYQVFYPIVPIYDGYYKFLFKDKSFIEKMNSYTISFRDGKNIAFEDFGNTYIPYPPIDEQKSIAEYLDKKCAEIDACIDEKKQQISVLETYKKSIIFEYVTGKKEVV